MLSNLFSSKTRAGLLDLFYNHPEDRFYMREIARRLRRDVSGIKRELSNLEHIGLLTSEKKGNLKYFYANRNSPIYNEMKGIILKTTGVIGSAKEHLAPISGIKTAFIYGTSGKVIDKKMNEIDLLIIGSVNIAELNDAITQLEDRLKRNINYLVFDDDEYKKRKEENDPFLADVLKEKKIMLIGREDEL